MDRVKVNLSEACGAGIMMDLDDQLPPPHTRPMDGRRPNPSQQKRATEAAAAAVCSPDLLRLRLGTAHTYAHWT